MHALLFSVVSIKYIVQAPVFICRAKHMIEGASCHNKMVLSDYWLTARFNIIYPKAVPLSINEWSAAFYSRTNLV